MPLPELELAALKTEIMSAAERYAKAKATGDIVEITRTWSDLFKAIDKVKE